MSWSSGFVFKPICWKDIHIQPNVQSLITMGKDRSFGNVFWSYNFRVFDTMKFVTFCNSWGHILELYAKAKSSLISQQVQFFNKKSKKTYNFMVPLMGGI